MPKITRINFTVARTTGDLKHKGGESPSFFWDTEEPGLGLKVTASGNRTFIFQKRLKGEAIRIKIGPVDEWPLSEAKAEACRLRNLIKQGVDPREEKKASKIDAERAQMTLGSVFQLYIDAHPRKVEFPDRKDAWSDRHRVDHEYAARRILKPLLETKLSDVTVAVVRDWMDEATVQGMRNVALRQSFMYIAAAYRWAYKRPEKFGALADPVLFAHDDLLNRRPSARIATDKLHVSELKPWFDAVCAIPSKTISVYLRCLLLLGCRRRELSTLKWKDINHKHRTIHVHDKIDPKGRTVPIGPYVYHLLTTLPKASTTWVFAAARKMNEKSPGHLAEPTKAHKGALEAAGLSSDLSLHGLRRSFARFAGSVIPGNHARALTGHAPIDVHEGVYEQPGPDDTRPSIEKMEAFILEKAGVHFDVEAATEGLHVVKEA